MPKVFGLFQTSQRRIEASLRAKGEVIPTELGEANRLLRSITSLTLPFYFEKTSKMDVIK
jgi:hypothetical protein